MTRRKRTQQQKPKTAGEAIVRARRRLYSQFARLEYRHALVVLERDETVHKLPAYVVDKARAVCSSLWWFPHDDDVFLLDRAGAARLYPGIVFDDAAGNAWLDGQKVAHKWGGQGGTE